MDDQNMWKILASVFFKENSEGLKLIFHMLVLWHLQLLKSSEYFWIWWMSAYVLITRIPTDG